jgi:riboflavin-specific deaminase-like protein
MHKPHVTVTFAQSLDGRIATSTGESRWISGQKTLKLAHRLRRASDAIAVGIGTVLRDDPELSCRLVRGSSPLRVVLDSRLRIPLESKLGATAGRYPTLVFHGGSAPAARCEELFGAKIETVCVGQVDRNHLDLGQVLAALHSRGVHSLLVEGGSGIITSLLAQRLADRLVIVTAPIVIGTGVPAVGSLGIERLADASRFTTRKIRRMGSDLVWELLC